MPTTDPTFYRSPGVSDPFHPRETASVRSTGSCDASCVADVATAPAPQYLAFGEIADHLLDDSRVSRLLGDFIPKMVGA